MPAPTEHLTFDLRHGPDFAWVSVVLRPGQRVCAEPGAMATMSPGVRLKAGFASGLWGTLSRMMSGESARLSTYEAGSAGGEVSLAPPGLGEVVHIHLDGSRPFLLQRGAYLAGSPGLKLNAAWQGARGFFAGKGLFLLQVTGAGDLFFYTYGGALKLDVTQETYVDTGYVAAFDASLSYSVTTMPGIALGTKIKTFIFGGEGLVVRFSGQGRVWVQTRAMQPLLRFLWPFRLAKKRLKSR